MRDNTYLSDKQLAARFGNSRASVWRWTKTTNFPQPIKLSQGCTRWRLSEIEEWEKAKEVA